MFKKIAVFMVGFAVLVALSLGLWNRDHWQDYEIVTRDDYEIIRDDYGVPLVVGQSDPAVAYGIAIAHAEDDFETIQIPFLAIRRHLGAVNGKDGAGFDYLSYLLQAPEIAAATTQDLSPETRAWISAYADGLNAFAREHPKRVLRKDLFPLTAEDIAANFALSGPLFFGLEGVIGTLREGGELPGTPLPLKKGSNAFAIAPSRSSDGRTRLVSNSHQPWEGLFAWYEIRVESAEGWRFYGANFPGAPFPLMGHNDWLGWTNTVNRPDLVDVYALTLSDNKKHYKFGDQWLELETRREWLRVKWGPFILPVPQKFYRSVHGPVIINDNGAFALRYPGMINVNQVQQYHDIIQAKTWEEWREVMAMQAIPSTNFIYGDRAGNIAFLYNAALPVRDPAYDWWNILPGDDPDALWQDFVPSSQIPQILNPPSGYLANANNSPFMATADGDNLDPEDYSQVIGIEGFTTNRIVRSLALFAAEEKTSAQTLRAITYDTGYEKTSPMGEWMQKTQSLPADGDLEEAVLLLRQWDWSQDGEGRADALAGLMLLKLRLAGYQIEEAPDLQMMLEESADYLQDNFGRLDPPLKDILRLRRGDIDLPLTGGPDALRALLWEEDGDGKLRANFGDSFIMFVTWDETGVTESKTIQPYGSNIQDESSPHYNDQSQMFVDMELKDTGFVARKPLWLKELQPENAAALF